MAQIDDFRPCEMTDYWKDRRPPAERLPDCERLLESAQDDISRYRGTIDILHRHINTIETEIERLRAERDELLAALKKITRDRDSDDDYIVLTADIDKAAALLAKLENRTDD